jgi:hypothetical protein
VLVLNPSAGSWDIDLVATAQLIGWICRTFNRATMPALDPPAIRDV